jgi:hypothetical protein
MRKGKVALVAVGCAAALVACGAPVPKQAAPATPSPSVSPSAAPTPSPSSVVLPRAADGTNVRACFDATCEILVTGRTKIPVDEKYGLATLEVASISSSGVDFHAVAPDGTQLNASQQRPDQGGASTLNHVRILIVAMNDKGAVIKLSRA